MGRCALIMFGATECVAMDERCMIELFIAFGREISEIRAANRVYWARSVHNNLEQELHERRRGRLQEIRKNFLLWFGIPLPETFPNKGERDGRQVQGLVGSIRRRAGRVRSSQTAGCARFEQTCARMKDDVGRTKSDE
jgi:hypothetical protein